MKDALSINGIMTMLDALRAATLQCSLSNLDGRSFAVGNGKGQWNGQVPTSCLSRNWKGISAGMPIHASCASSILRLLRRSVFGPRWGCCRTLLKCYNCLGQTITGPRKKFGKWEDYHPGYCFEEYAETRKDIQDECN